jgi:hypothetical protein
MDPAMTEEPLATPSPSSVESLRLKLPLLFWDVYLELDLSFDLVPSFEAFCIDFNSLSHSNVS